MTTINENFWFKPKEQLTIDDIVDSLNLYKTNFTSAFKLDSQFIIFLDTNVLLAYYGMHPEEQDKLKKFLFDNQNRIHITSQIVREYIRNRTSTIKKNSADFDNLLKEIKEGTDKIDVAFKSFNNSFTEIKNLLKKRLSKNFPDSWKKLQDIEAFNIDYIFNNPEFNNEIDKAIKDYKDNYKKSLFEDDLLEIIKDIKRTNDLTEGDKKFIKEKYAFLLKLYEASKKDSKSNSKYTFPGCGEIKYIDPEGDFIIYHEMLKFMKDKNTDVVFLTNDITKGDWINTDKTAIMHYLENTYKNTKHHMYILEAEKPLQISFEQIFNQDRQKQELLKQKEAYLAEIGTRQNALENTLRLKQGLDIHHGKHPDLDHQINNVNQSIRDEEQSINYLNILVEEIDNRLQNLQRQELLEQKESLQMEIDSKIVSIDNMHSIKSRNKRSIEHEENKTEVDEANDRYDSLIEQEKDRLDLLRVYLDQVDNSLQNLE